MSKQGLELLKDLSEVRDAVTSLDNLCIGAAEPFDSTDFKVFTSNKRNVSIFTFIPNNFSFQLSSIGGIGNSYRLEIPKSQDVDLELVNLNIFVGDIVTGYGIQPSTKIERVDVYGNRNNSLGLPVTELVLSKQLTANIPSNTQYTLIKQNNATIAENRFVLGRDVTNNFYNGDKITAIYYPLSTSTTPILSTNTVDLYIVDNSFNSNNQFCFGLSLNEGGEKINISSVNSLCAIDFLRSNEVTNRDFRNIFLPEAVDYMDADPNSGANGFSYDGSREFYSLINSESVDKALTEIEQQVDYTSAVLNEKIDITKDNINQKGINIEGVLRVADPGVLNNGSISPDSRAPSLYILDPTSSSLTGVRIFSTFDSPWITTSNSLSTNKNINVGSLAFEKNIFLENATVQAITPISVRFTRKIPISITDSDGSISTYYLLASSQN
jgi:hypothetical protein